MIEPAGAVRLPMAADLYNDAGNAAPVRWRETLPGLVIVALGTLAAAFVAGLYGVPLTLMALLLGLSLNFLSGDARLGPGLALAAGPLLRWGIVLMGLRVTFGQVAALGPAALVAVAAIIAVTIGLSLLVAPRLGIGRPFATVAGGAVAICGASAALAIAAVLGERRAGRTDVTLVLIGISAMSAGAMLLYPMVTQSLALSDLRAGFVLGASIHDVAQALGAGFAVSPEAGQIAAIVKLTRVAMLAPVLAILILVLPRAGGRSAAPPLPWFVAGFFILAGINSLGLVPPAAASAADGLATAMLAAAVTAIAIRSPLPRLKEAGIRPLLLIFTATVTAFALALLAAWMILP